MYGFAGCMSTLFVITVFRSTNVNSTYEPNIINPLTIAMKGTGIISQTFTRAHKINIFTNKPYLASIVSSITSHKVSFFYRS